MSQNIQRSQPSNVNRGAFDKKVKNKKVGQRTEYRNNTSTFDPIQLAQQNVTTWRTKYISQKVCVSLLLLLQLSFWKTFTASRRATFPMRVETVFKQSVHYNYFGFNQNCNRSKNFSKTFHHHILKLCNFAFTICTTSFNIPNFYILHTVYLCFV